MAAAPPRESRLSREAWLHHALEILRDEGIQGVKIDRMSRSLGVTKGSFYWHFKDLTDLHQGMLKHWVEQYTEVISENPEYQEAEPVSGLLAAMVRIRRDRLDAFDVAMRSWADHDPIADKAVRAVNARRTKFVRSFFTRLGFRGLDAEIRARSTLCYLCWEPSMYFDDTEARRLTLLRRHLYLMTEK